VVVTNVAEPGAEDIIEDDPYALLELRDLFNNTRKLPWVEDFVYDKMLDLAYIGGKDRIGSSHAVLAHPRNVRFMEMEYTVPAERGVQCLREILATIREKMPDVCFPLEYRYIKGDDSLIGMFSERDGCSISVHQFTDESNWKEYLSLIETIFHKYEGRPHWGKWHSLRGKQLGALYPHWDLFRRIQREIDPTGRMLNPYLRQLLGQA
jgi:FAD/FMN-containing dehydrogenase